MKIKTVDIENGLQHAKLKVDFSDFNVIIGPNGCGKSSIIELIGYALTGKFTWPGSLDTVVRQGEEKGSVSLVLESEGDLIDLSVALGRTSKKLTRGDLKIGKTTEVLEYLEQAVLRTPFEVVNEASIIRQGMLTEGLFTTQAKRQHAFQRLAGLIDIESKRKVLADAKLLVAPHMLTFNIEEHKRQVTELSEKQKLLNTELHELKASTPDEAQYDTFKQLLASIEMYNKHNGEYVVLKQEKLELAPVMQEAEANLKQCQTKSKTLRLQFKDVSEKYTTAISLLSTFEANEKRVQNKKSLLKRLGAAETEKGNLVLVPPSFVQQESLDELRELKTIADTGIEHANKVINALSAEDKVCPVCSTSLDDPRELIEANRATKAEFEEISASTLVAIQGHLKDKSTWEKKLSQYNSDLSRLTSQIENLKMSLDEISDVEDIEVDDKLLSDARIVVSEYGRLSTEVEASLAPVADAESLYRTAKEAMAECDTKLASVTKFIADLGTPDLDRISEDNIQKLEAGVAEFESHRASVSEFKGRIAEVDSALLAAKQSLETVKKQIEVSNKYSQYANHVEFARGVLHRDSYPSGKIQNFIERVLVNSEAYLEVINAGFTVSYDHESGFVAHFPKTGHVIRADRLSGGEKITFALAFRFAVNEVRSETGFLIMDEPTVHLDEEHVDRMIDVLGMVKKKLAGRVQIIIVTHNERMSAVADTVIEVPSVSL